MTRGTGGTPTNIDDQRLITIRYLEHLTRSLRQTERRRREDGEHQEAHHAAVWAERANELRHKLLEMTNARP